MRAGPVRGAVLDAVVVGVAVWKVTTGGRVAVGGAGGGVACVQAVRMRRVREIMVEKIVVGRRKVSTGWSLNVVLSQ